MFSIGSTSSLENLLALGASGTGSPNLLRAALEAFVVDDQVDYHLFINKQRLKLLNYCDPDTKGKLLEKIQNFEKDVSNIIDVKNNNLLKNKYTYSSTLILKKKTNKKSF